MMSYTIGNKEPPPEEKLSSVVYWMPGVVPLQGNKNTAPPLDG